MNGYNKNGTIWKYEVFSVGFSLHPVAGFDFSRLTGLCSLQPSNGSEIFKAPQGKPREPQQNLLPFGGKPSALFWSKNCDPL
jgi:DNA/RNA-binding domain of Phe-tRNA-synthetase-like protein